LMGFFSSSSSSSSSSSRGLEFNPADQQLPKPSNCIGEVQITLS
jgi:hypothetical protein